MELKEQIVMVTGANGGIGSALVRAFLDAGAKKVYACARKAETLAGMLADQRVQPVELDITDPSSIEAAAAAHGDVTILVNNAGANQGGLLGTPLAARTEMDVNYFGNLSMCTAFAPLLGANGGGCIVNIVSILAMVNMPSVGTYSASKAALHSVTQGMRGVLAGQGTRVIGVYPGPVATRMTEGLEMPMATPAGVAQEVIAGIIADCEEIYPDEMSKGVCQGLAADAKAVERQFAAF
ncbi:SDR family oxidoreductase [Geobacter pickeringii]|uniref:Short-chain dehydrogenase n=1 Tax=Geobacter pickeringii TaxID=345632 RepID=A0A0B5BGK6_9BACT|nr:SDR family oxidoreductase [Geobacter pickeringii]AJE04309.1 short-chain dehydrogenase [Geobacter pickeringii]